MKKPLVVACALAFLLAGCAADPKAFRDFGVRTRNVAYASVQVVDGSDKPYVIVSQEPIYVQQEDDNAIYWSLPSGGSYYFLPKTSRDPGIVFDNPQMPRTECDNYNQDKWTYVCTYKKANRAKYPYTIRVTKDGTTIVKSDPTAMNN